MDLQKIKESFYVVINIYFIFVKFQNNGQVLFFHFKNQFY